MAFPTVASLTETTVASMTTTHNISLGATVNAGDLLLMIFVGSQVGADQLYTITTPTGFTRRWSRQFDLAAQNRQHVAVFVKEAVGDEDGTTVNVATSSSVSAVAHVYRIDAGTWSGDLKGIACSTYTQADAANPNPASLTVPWGAADNLWLAIATWEDSDFFASAAPSSYTNLTTEIADSTEDAVISSARRENAVATEDPGTFTASSEKYLALTIGIAPNGATMPTFPVIPTVADGRILFQNNTAGGATKTFPSLSNLNKSEGDLLIAICIEYDGNSTNAEFSAWGGGFTEIADRAGTTTMAIGVAYKFATGAESGTFTVTTADTSANDSVMILLSIPWAHESTPPEVSTMTVGTTSAADFDSITVSWGSADNLWIYVVGSGETGTGGSFTGVTAIGSSTGYAESGITADAVGGVEAAVAFSPETTATQDNATATVDVSNARNAALTIGVRPLEVAAATEIDSIPGLAIALAPPQTVDVQVVVAVSSPPAFVIGLAVAPEVSAAVANPVSIASIPGIGVGLASPPDVSASIGVSIEPPPALALGLSLVTTVADLITIAPPAALGIGLALPPDVSAEAVEITGTAAVDQEDQTSAASGQAGVQGAVAETQDNQTATASGWVEITGTVAETQDDQTSSASGQAGVQGSLAETQEDQTSVASGSFLEGIVGSANITQENQTSAASGQAGVQGTVDVTQEDQTSTATGVLVVPIEGTLAVSQESQILVAVGVVYGFPSQGGKVGRGRGSPRVRGGQPQPASVSAGPDDEPGPDRPRISGGGRPPSVGTE